MKKVNQIILTLFLVLCIALPLTASGIQYDFDEVEVIYAAEFTAVPTSPGVNNWLTELAGGSEKPVNVLYGIVNLKSQSGITKEEFIKVMGENGAERFLANSMTTQWYDAGEYTKIQSMETVFWSGKQLVDNSVVKDYSKPLKVITLQKHFDEQQNLTAVTVSFSGTDGSEGANTYFADITTLNMAGNPQAKN